MSRNNPIPVSLREKFKAHMEAHDWDDLPDGAWFANLEAAAERFCKNYKLNFADPNAAAHQYLRMKQAQAAPPPTGHRKPCAAAL